MMKIATHNSATGEAGRGILSFLVAPFSKCQSKTIKEQYEAGCRYFDIRYKWSEDRFEHVCAHGLWESQKNLHEVLNEINWFGDCYVMMTCESGEPMSEDDIFFHIKNYPNIKFTCFTLKHPEWKMVWFSLRVPILPMYKNLDWSSWHTLLPIPWLWKKVYYDKPEFNEEIFTMVDFL